MQFMRRETRVRFFHPLQSSIDDTQYVRTPMKSAIPPAAASGAPVAPVYEHRAKCNKLAIIQTVLYVLSFISLHGVFYYGILGLATGFFGIVATRTPMTVKQVKYVNVYYSLNIVLIVFEIFTTIVWLYLTFAVSEIDTQLNEATETWFYISVIVGLICQVAIVGVTCLALKTSKLFKNELIRNPPRAFVYV